MPESQYLTPDGEANLRAELKQLKEVERPALAVRLREAIQMGDLSENADYKKAKEDQGFLEGKIQELEYILAHAKIIDPNAKPVDRVDVGSTVTVQEEGLEPEKFYIVGAKEADPRNGRISNESPIGKALLGHKLNERVIVQVPNGQLVLKILKIE